ncbi:MAG: hypothetical protein ACPG5W_10615 [Flavobacteriales bacterium]
MAQSTNHWLGGALGAENAWEEGRNWSLGSTPDEDTHVVIEWSNSGHNQQPVITLEANAASVKVFAGATLVIQKTGNLLIDGEFIYSEGISLYGGNVKNKGVVHLQNLATDVAEQLVQNLTKEGEVILAEPLLTNNL